MIKPKQHVQKEQIWKWDWNNCYKHTVNTIESIVFPKFSIYFLITERFLIQFFFQNITNPDPYSIQLTLIFSLAKYPLPYPSLSKYGDCLISQTMMQTHVNKDNHFMNGWKVCSCLHINLRPIANHLIEMSSIINGQKQTSERKEHQKKTSKKQSLSSQSL